MNAVCDVTCIGDDFKKEEIMFVCKENTKMFQPIVYCQIVKAFESEAAMKSLKEVVAYNKKYGHFPIWKCKHTPPCRDLTEKEIVKIEEMLK